jgi:hypothetical protein
MGTESKANQIYSADLMSTVDSYTVIQNIPFFYGIEGSRQCSQNASLGHPK